MATRDASSSVVKTVLTGRFDYTIAIDNYRNGNNQYLHMNCSNEIQRPIANDSQYECLKERNGLNAIPIIYHTLFKKIHPNLTINISRQ
jgi:hypothetical protein